jgi:hypothetical protein
MSKLRLKISMSLDGGAQAAQRHLAAAPVDAMRINPVATLLGNGERLFE